MSSHTGANPDPDPAPTPDRSAHPAVPGRRGRRRGRGGRGERQMVPDATFTSYYGRPIVKVPRWEEREIAGYLFLGGLAGGSSLVALGADLTGRVGLRRAGRAGMAVGGALSAAALIKDLGRPMRFVNMLRVAKPTSPMSMGTWLLSGFGLFAGPAVLSEVTPLLPLPDVLDRAARSLGRAGGVGAAAFGSGVAAYTAVLIADTAMPAWHGAHRELPWVFVASAAVAASGAGLLGAPVEETGPLRRLVPLAAAGEQLAFLTMQRRLGMVAEVYHHERVHTLEQAARWLTIGGAVGAVTVAGRNRAAAAVVGTALLAASAATRFAIYRAGIVSGADPKYTVVPQRERLAARAAQDGGRTADTGTPG